MRLKIRTVFALTVLAPIASVTGVLMTISLTGAVRTSMEFAERFTSEQVLGGLHAVEHLILDSERILNTESLLIRNLSNSPDLLDKLADFWIAYRRLTSHSHSAMAFILNKSGEGVICDKDGNVDIIGTGGPTGFEAIRHSTKAKTPINDIRQFPWFQQALLEKRLVVGEFHGFKGSWHEGKRRGINVSMPVPDPERNGEFLGVLAIDISTDWIGEYLENAMKRSIAKSEAFVVELGKDGRIVVVAHTGHDMDTIAGNDGLIHPEDLSDPLLSEAVLNFHYSPALIENASPSLREIRSLKGNYIATFMNVLPGRNPPWAICFLVSTDELLAPLWGRLGFNLAIIVATVVFFSALATWVSLWIARPIEAVTSAAREMGEMRFVSKEAPVRSMITEVDDLAKATDSMRSGMRAFMQYIPEEILKRYLKPGNIASLDNETVPVTILFSDIKDFSTVAERIDPMSLVRHLNDYLEILSTEVSRHGGTVDKYIGDAVMSFWNAPIRVPGHARQAFSAALVGRKALDTANARWKAAGLPEFITRMGIHTGEVIVGNIGSSVRLNYTIIGDAVNLASRLESLNKQYGTSILVSEPARIEAGEEFLTRPVDLVAVKGKTEPVLVHELIGWRADCSPDQVDLAAMTTLAHDAYRARRFTDARDAYAAILARWIHDGVSQRMMDRADELIRVPPPANWSGVHRTPFK